MHPCVTEVYIELNTTDIICFTLFNGAYNAINASFPFVPIELEDELLIKLMAPTTSLLVT